MEGGRKMGRGDIVRGVVVPGDMWRGEEDRRRVGAVRMGRKGRCWCFGEPWDNQQLEGMGPPQTPVLVQSVCVCVCVRVRVRAC